MKSEKQLFQWDVNQYLIELQPTAEKPAMSVTRTEPSGRTVFRCFTHQNRQIIEPGGTLEERVAVLEEVLQDQVMAVREEEKGGD